MAKIKVLNLDNVKRQTRFKILKEIRDPKLMQDIGEVIKHDIQNGEELSPLKDSTIRNRRYLKIFNAVDSQYGDTRSNVTFTGELLRALEVRVNTVMGLIVVGFKSGVHRRYKTGAKPSKATAQQITYEDLAKELQEGNENMKPRPFMVLREYVLKDITKRVKDHLKNVLK